MKILYGIQGTGNGHISRAEDVVPILQDYGQVDILISGSQSDLRLPFPVTYQSKGLSFYFGKKGGIDFIKTIKKSNTNAVVREINSFPIKKYDLVVNDFEPISAWAAKKNHVPCVSLSHQSALLSTKVPRPKHRDLIGDWILKNYAPADAHVGFHFAQFDQDIFTPVIGQAIRNASVERGSHYTVYLPAYSDEKLIPLLGKISGTHWQVFSKSATKPYRLDTISVFPVDKKMFVSSMVSSQGVLCGAGFETPAEALFLGKKLLVVPMKRQYEQHYNAAALKELGVGVLKSMKFKHLDMIQRWVSSDHALQLNFPDTTRDAVERALLLGGYKNLS